ncbi:hypothetical protein COV82_02415 [Candidatus Peregrinibacteria bacterium CG11_big_fil_rev_8_21_14_0_20_46_8]|nr:MAG: hypothetical protein COV82_02415 [Candidatus Peregrinibacteria bacterium CG11_big_fil_rev_8_21_14_0_20_46_8]
MGKFSDNLKKHVHRAMPAHHEPLWKRIIIWLLLLAIAGMLAGFFVFTLAVAILSIGLPDVRDFNQLAGVESTVIYDREGGILYTIHGEENRQYVPLEEISPLLQKATISIEDDQFYTHSGFDIPGILRGLAHEITGFGARRGGSTITQQLAKNAFLSPKRVYTRKMKELILSIRLERAYDKEKILELYLNRIPYGNNAYGAELASRVYFDKSAKDLTLAEASILASLPKAPSFFSPFGPNVFSSLNIDFDGIEAEKLPRNIADLGERDFTLGLIGREISFSEDHKLYIPGRTDLVLKRMEDLGFIVEEERRAALADLQELDFKKHRISIKAPHFVFYIRALLEEEFGKEVVEQGGLQVYTTIDPKLQELGEELVAETIEAKREQHNVSHGALLSLDAETGQILAMVGSADYFDENGGSINHVFSLRQPGSSFKPLVYAKAFLNRYSPATVLYDVDTNFGAGYRPDNFDGKFLGPMSIRYALAQSRNIPALKAYFLAGQQEEIIPFVEKLGVTSLNPNGDYGPPLAIGTGETTLAQMVTAFSVFANEGKLRDMYGIIKVVDRDGDTLVEHFPDETPPKEVLDPQVAYLISSILSDTSINLGPRLTVPGHAAAAKTGTSNKEISANKILPSNAWTIGYTRQVVTGVWAGNSNGEPMKIGGGGYNTASPIWHPFMIAAHEGLENKPWRKPSEIKEVTVSRATGLLPGPLTPDHYKTKEEVASFAIPTETEDVFVRTKVNTLDGLLPTPQTPEEYIEERLFMNHKDPIDTFALWGQAIRGWVAAASKSNPEILPFPPTETTPIFTEETLKNKPTIQITSPSAFSTISGAKVPVKVKVKAPHGVEKVQFFRDDRSLPYTTERDAPYTGFVRFGGSVDEGKHLIRARVYDSIGFFDEAVIEVDWEEEEEDDDDDE